MLPRFRRLKKNADFQLVLNTGFRKRVGDLLFFFLSREQDCSRLGIVASRKVSKSAVVRNRIRRVLSSAVQADIEGWKKKPIGDLVIMVTGLPKEPFHETLMSSWRKWLNG